MKRRIGATEGHSKKSRVLHFRFIGKERIKVDEPVRSAAYDNCASCRLDEVIRALGS
ncbi:MAG: hypothetical protein HY675_17355 [Chloroflexi bacterium]|nr:hypothetical protein [Chloroflexota bacterium]